MPEMTVMNYVTMSSLLGKPPATELEAETNAKH